MARVLVVDDSPSIRALLGKTLRGHGHEVDEASDAETAAERAAAAPPDVIVTDLVMTGLSGVQLCRVLRNDPATAHIPVVLLTASGDKRSRFWARSAGAAAYVSKDRLDDLVSLLPALAATSVGQRPSKHVARGPERRTLYERMSSILDTQLFDSVLAGEVRALASAGELEKLFEGLASLLNEVMSYRWIALATERTYAPVFLHGNVALQEATEHTARAALNIAATSTIYFIGDERPLSGDGPPPETTALVFAGSPIGRFSIAPSGRGLSRDDKRLLALVSAELGGPVQMAVLYEDARRLATTDMLTGLLNRRAFLDAMNRERARSDRHTFPMSLLLLDIDHFKSINDGRGHAAGDAVLQGVAQVLLGVARKSDFVARWGGEEFVVGLPQTSEAGARIAGERVRRAIVDSRHAMPDGSEPVQVSVSVGIASCEAPWTIDALVSSADAAMYVAKGRGRNRVEWGPMHEPGEALHKRQRAAGPRE
ncbi:MAG: diguanylate cyclase [Myxococcota bacterium]|nr:diguanylate cyclase [Myxococcota bacterium]